MNDEIKILDDYAIDGVNIHCKEAEVFLKKLNKLKKYRKKMPGTLWNRIRIWCHCLIYLHQEIYIGKIIKIFGIDIWIRIDEIYCANCSYMQKDSIK